MKCPNCGKKLKSTICANCGCDFTPKAEEPVSTINMMNVKYFTYNPEDPSVIYPMSVVPNTPAEPEVIPMSKKEAKQLAKAEKKARNAVLNKNWVSRLFAVLLMALSLAALAVVSFGAVLQFVTVGANAVPDVQYGSLWQIFSTALKSETKAFGVLPALFSGEKGDLYNLSIYVFAVCALLALIHALFANLNADKAPKRVRRSLFFLGLGALVYSIAMALLLNAGVLNETNLLKLNVVNLVGFYFDTFSLILGVACLILSYILCLHGKLKAKKA